MSSVLTALLDALKTLLHPRMLSLVLWPMLIAIVLWAGAAAFFWESWVDGMTSILRATPLEHWMAQGFFSTLSHYLIVVILVLMLIAAVYLTALAITSVFAMPVMVNHVARARYPELELKRGGSAIGSILNATFAIAVYCAGWLLSLPLWLFNPLALVLPLALAAYLNQRLFRYDALAEHASREEYEQVVRRSAAKLYLLGAFTAVLQFVPLLNLFLPIYVGLAFIHLCLAELKGLRQPE